MKPGLDDARVRSQLRAFIRAELLQDPNGELADDEPLFSGGLIDSAGMALLGVFVEDAFGIYVPDVELAPESVDTVDRIVALLLRAGAQRA